MSLYRIIDSNGLFLRDDFTANDGEIALDVQPAQGFYQPRWDGTQWVEGRTQAEIDAILASATLPEVPLDQRVSAVETDVDDLITVLAVIEGVSL